jgi:hypothetical protein
LCVDDFLTTLRNAEIMLQSLPDQINGNPVLQEAITDVMKGDVDALERFEKLIAKNRPLANQILLSAVSALTNLQVVNGIKSELRTRSEAN